MPLPSRAISHARGHLRISRFARRTTEKREAARSLVNRFLKLSFFPANKRRDLKISKLKETNSDILKFRLGSEAWGNKTKEIILRLSNEKYISLVFSPTPRSQI